MTKCLELWLDESGDFQQDNNLNRNPSLVGGVLIEKNKLYKNHLSKILGSEYVHSNEINKGFGAFSLHVLQSIIEYGGQLIIFENEERLQIVDSTITYLNILSEGIIQLLQLLSAEYGQVELDILIAVRLDMEKQEIHRGDIIQYNDYVSRLEEKIILGLARRSLVSRNYKYSVKLASARNDQRLMISDVVCNSWLTRNSKKFTDEQRTRIQKMFLEKYRFTVFEKSTTAYIKRLIAEGELAEAIFEIYTTKEKN